MLKRILDVLLANGWSADNLTYGSGGGLLQKMNRDTCRYAFKCSAAKVAGIYRVSTNNRRPIRQTIQGRELKLIQRDGKLITVREEAAQNERDQLVEVFCDGNLVEDWSWDRGRTRADRGF